MLSIVVSGWVAVQWITMYLTSLFAAFISCIFKLLGIVRLDIPCLNKEILPVTFKEGKVSPLAYLLAQDHVNRHRHSRLGIFPNFCRSSCNDKRLFRSGQ